MFTFKKRFDKNKMGFFEMASVVWVVVYKWKLLTLSQWALLVFRFNIYFLSKFKVNGLISFDTLYLNKCALRRNSIC
jgi:hypothetical protein